MVGSLEDTIQTLKQQLPGDTVKQTQLHQATQLFLSSLHLLCELKKDRNLLQLKGRESKSGGLFPSPDQIPAITSVIHDAALFRALVRCLHTDMTLAETPVSIAALETTSTVVSAIHANNGGNAVAGRKRSLSMSIEQASNINKSMKTGLSPIPCHPRTSSAITLQNIASRNNNRNNNVPTFNLQVLAATILFTAFQFVDHWPVPLIKAYAEDCFGPRLWVDHKQCALLVANLSLVHDGNDEGATAATGESSLSSSSISDLETDAAKVAETYKAFCVFDHAAPSSPSRRRESITDSQGHGRAAARAFQVQQFLSSTSSGSLNETTKKKGVPQLWGQKISNPQHGMDSDSGDEDENVINERSVNDISNPYLRNKDDTNMGGGSFSPSHLSDSDDNHVDFDQGKERKRRDELNTNDDVGESASYDGSWAGTAGQLRNESVPSETASADSNHGYSTSALGSMNGSNIEALYPILQRRLRLERVRRRFFGANLESAHDAITSSFSDRLDVKSKQNSSLLHCLPSFTSIPGVRGLIAANLEKWLQSPALAGLARTLFSSTVNYMKNVDPPLPDDLRAIDSIIGMRLKANQINAHIANITAIAKKIPVASVANHMYSKLLRELVTQNNVAVGADTDQLKMIGAVHRAISPQVSYDALAAALLVLMVNQGRDAAHASFQADRDHLIKTLRNIIRALASHLGPLFEGCLLVDALLSFDVNTDSWSARDEEDKARLMFQCVTLSVTPFVVAQSNGSNLSENDVFSIKESLHAARKLFLTWCCTEYGPHHSSKGPLRRSDYFSSVLGPPIDGGEGSSPWLNTMRCLLFLEEAESLQMKRFMIPGTVTSGDDSDWEQELPRIRLCCAYGGDLHNDLMWIVLQSASQSESIDSEMAIHLLEHLFKKCGQNRHGTLNVDDPHLVWELYNLVQYNPDVPVSIFCNEEAVEEDSSHDEDRVYKTGFREISRLAYPGLWWRVTMLALAMCGHSPSKIGALVWQEHPTLRALIKMVTANRFRFPTVDCDENERTEMKKLEQAARDEEMRTSEFLFLPRKREEKKEEQKGSRVSRRLLKQQREKEAMREITEAKRRNVLLREAQKTIMLWDPDGPARKPPRESVDLLLAVEELFNLSDIFQRSVGPDFLLMTIGQTTRGAIERAYDWLIPIISTIPDTIARLPSSASCFLLLRAYGTEGDERKQLKELSAPLLQHVRDSLQGRYGQADAVKAFDLLMTDVASNKPDRRRCARRVLHDSLMHGEPTHCIAQSWMLNVLQLDHAKLLVGDAVKHMSTAAGFERGRVLRALVMALEQHISFAKEHEIRVEQSFSELLIQLVSARPSVCAEAMDAYSNLRSLSLRVLHADFVRHARVEDGPRDKRGSPIVYMRVYESSLHKGEVFLPLSLLQSLSVVLSIWKDEHAEGSHETALLVQELADALLSPDNNDQSADDRGLASAKLLEDGTAFSVESWIMLAKSRSDALARRAALSAPAGYLSRLLLCSGLPCASLLTMIDRLGRLGVATESKDDVYVKLLAPSASSEWDVGRAGHNRDISRKLLGRLSAYLRLHTVSLQGENSDVSTIFLVWLSDYCKSNHDMIPNKAKNKKSKISENQFLTSLTSASSVLLRIQNDSMTLTSDVKVGNLEMDILNQCEMPSLPTFDFDVQRNAAGSFIASCMKVNRYIFLDEWLYGLLSKLNKKAFELETQGMLTELAVDLLKAYQSLSHAQNGATVILIKWLPRLSRNAGKPELWESIFKASTDPSRSAVLNILLTKCLTSWSMPHVAQCKDWIMTLDAVSGYDYERIALFLISTSEQPSPQIEMFSESYGVSLQSQWASSKEFVIFATAIAIRSLMQSRAPLEKALSRRNRLPTGFTLLFLLARCGKKQLRSVSNLILEDLAAPRTEDTIRNALEVVFLRLYLCFPHWMDLGSVAAREALMNASERQSQSWSHWRSSYDDKISGMLDALSSGEVRVTKSLSELSRKQPLFVLRELPKMTDLLQTDAAILSDDQRERKGVITGRDMSGDLVTVLHGKVVKMTVQHWGYSFTEPLWTSLLDVLAAMPREVLFSCGLKVGLMDFLTIYLELLSVQLQLMSAHSAARLKGKLDDFFIMFRQINLKGWQQWLGSKTDESEVHHLLVSCNFISPEEAIESRKNGNYIH